MEIDVQGAHQVLESCEDVVCVLLVPPTKQAQAERLRARGDAEEAVLRRLELGDREVEDGTRFADAIVINNDVDEAARELAAIINEARRRASGAPGPVADGPSTPTLRSEMAEPRSTMIDPPIEILLESVGSKFGLVTLASKRARQINSYFNQLGEGLGAIVPPQVTSLARKPLSIALEEIAEGKVQPGVIAVVEDDARRSHRARRRRPARPKQDDAGK